MECPECGSETEDCSGLDEDDYTVWGECCTACDWTNLDKED